MMTRKHLQALAVAMADVAVEQGRGEDEAVASALYVIRRLQQISGVTEFFDPGRFETAVRSAYRGE